MARAIFGRKRWLPSTGHPETQTDRQEAGQQDTPPSETGTGQEQQTGESRTGRYLERYLEQNRRPEESDYHEGADWLKTLTPPMTAEEEEKRKKAATAVEAVGHIGNIVTALSNLLYTQHGVRPVTLPKVPSAGTGTFGERMRAMREKHEARRQQAVLMDRSAYEKALDAWRGGYTDAANLDLKEEEARRRAKDDADNLAMKGRELDIRERETRRKEQKDMADRITGGGNAAGGGGRTVRVLNARGGYDIYRTEDLENDNNISYVYQNLPDRYKVRDENDFLNAKRDGDGRLVFPFRKKLTKGEMLAAIASAIADGEKETFSEPLTIGTGGKRTLNGYVKGKKKLEGYE